MKYIFPSQDAFEQGQSDILLALDSKCSAAGFRVRDFPPYFDPLSISFCVRTPCPYSRKHREM